MKLTESRAIILGAVITGICGILAAVLGPTLLGANHTVNQPTSSPVPRSGFVPFDDVLGVMSFAYPSAFDHLEPVQMRGRYGYDLFGSASGARISVLYVTSRATEEETWAALQNQSIDSTTKELGASLISTRKVVDVEHGLIVEAKSNTDPRVHYLALHEVDSGIALIVSISAKAESEDWPAVRNDLYFMLDSVRWSPSKGRSVLNGLGNLPVPTFTPTPVPTSQPTAILPVDTVQETTSLALLEPLNGAVLRGSSRANVTFKWEWRTNTPVDHFTMWMKRDNSDWFVLEGNIPPTRRYSGVWDFTQATTPAIWKVVAAVGDQNYSSLTNRIIFGQ